MERRLDRLEVLWSAGPQAIREASWDIQLTLVWCPDADPQERAAAIATTHRLETAGLARAADLALTRIGVPRREAQELAALPLAEMLAVVQTAANQIEQGG